MFLFIPGLILFLGSHMVRVVAPDVRARFIQNFSLGTWRALYSIVSVAALTLLAYGFAAWRAETGMLYSPPAFLAHISLTLMLFATIFLVAGQLPAGYIRTKIKHPMVLAVKIWAVAHLMVNGETNSVVLFTAFLAWGVIVRISLKRRERAGEITLATYRSWTFDLASVVVGLVAYAAIVFKLHEWLIGVAPINM